MLTYISALKLWSKGIPLITSSGMKDEYAPFFLVGILFSISLIAVVGCIKFWGVVETLLSKIRQSADKKVRLESFRALIEKAIPHLPASQIDILKELSQCERSLVITKDGVSYLEKQHYIKRLHNVSYGLFIFEIDPVVKSELSTYLKQERAKKLEKFVENITEDEIRFLTLFYSETVSEGTRESNKMMEPNVFRSGENMAKEGILDHFLKNSKTSDNEAFRIKIDTVEILRNTVFNKDNIRDEVYLDPNFIIATYASGGGAIGKR